MTDVAVLTDRGERPVNEDAVGTAEHDGNRCFVLCDGLGGHGMGDVASALVRDYLLDAFERSCDPKRFLTEAMNAAQQVLTDEQTRRQARQKMKTTAVCLVTDKRTAHVAYVGDSRFYAFAKGRVAVCTRDHSVPQMLVQAHEITEHEIRHHPDRSLLLRVMGVPWEEAQFETLKPLPLKRYDAFLLCSDGFWEWIDEDTMERHLSQSASAQDWLARMAATVRENGGGHGMDNWSAIAVYTR